MANINTKTLRFLRQWNNGDEGSLNGLLQRHLSWIYDHVDKRLGKFLRGKGDLNDYVQDAIMEFLRYGPKIEISNDDHFRAMLVRIVENTLRGKYDWYTTQRRKNTRVHPLPTDTVLYLDPPKKKVERPSQAVQNNEQEAWIRLGMELLDPEDSEIIILHQWEFLSFEEIGAQLEISQDAARMRHVRAVKRLSQKVGHLRRGELGKALEERQA